MGENGRNGRSTRFSLRVGAAVCALVVLCSAFPLAAMAETPAERYERLKGELNTLAGQIADAQSDKEAAEALRDSLAQEKQVVDELIAINQQEIDDTRSSLANKEDEVAKKREALSETQDLLGQRLVAIYTMNNSSTLSTLLSVNSFSEFLQMVDAMKRISTRDTKLIDDLNAQRADLEAEEAEIRALLEKLNLAYQELAGNAATLAGNIRAQNGEISEKDALLQASETAYGATAAETERAYQEMMAASNAVSGLGSAPGEGIPGVQPPPAPAPEPPPPPPVSTAPEAPPVEGGTPEQPAPEQPTPEQPAPPPAEPPPPVMGSITAWPVPSSRKITCYYGQLDPAGRPHLGMDIAAPYNTPIVAAGNGTVILAASHSSYGNYLIIDHGNGLKTLYAHCNSLLVGVGTYVTAGQTIALMGSTGFSTGSHLHIEVHNPGRQDPLGYLP